MKETECHRIADPVTNSTVCDSWSSRRGDLSLHQPALVDPAHSLDQREDPKGARPKVGPRFSTQTIAEEAQGSQGGDGFLLAPVRATEDIRSAHLEGTCAH